MKVWKRCLAALLSFTILYSSTGILYAAGTFSEKFQTWTATKAEVLAEYYELSSKESAVILNNAVNQGYEYLISYPYANVENSKKNLVAVDYLEKKIYAKAYANGGYLWKPMKATITSSEGDLEPEIVNLTEGICYFNNLEYNAHGAFTYSGNSYTVDVTYELWVENTAEEHNRILSIPAIFAETAKVIEKGLYALDSNAGKLGDMAKYLPELLAVEFPVEKTIFKEVEDEEGNITKVSETVQTTEPAFDSESHAEVIEAIQKLYQECTENSGMKLYGFSQEYIASCKTAGAPKTHNILGFALEKGAQILEQSRVTYEYINVLKNSSRLGTVLKKLQTTDPELYANVQSLQSISRNMIGTGSRPGALQILCEESYWRILDATVKGSIFAKRYSESDFAELEAAVYALKNETVTVPAMKGNTVLAASVNISCKITICNINITVKGKVTFDEVENEELVNMEPVTMTIKLLAGTSAEEAEKAVVNSGIEKKALSLWNDISREYQINTGNYERESTSITKPLTKDMEYNISYMPKYFKVKTNFAGSHTLPYGYQLYFPASEDDEICYDYEVETETGKKVTYNDGGIVYRITKDVTITKVEGKEKTEYRLYDFLVEDVQYNISEEAKAILGNSAVDSPILKIRIPDGNTVDEITEENGIFSVTARIVDAGAGMKWEPHIAYVMNGENIVKEVFFENGTASWDFDGFTHVKVDYRLKIEKVKDGVLNRELDEVEDVLYALNLPYELVTDVVNQNRLLSGDVGVTVKNMYEKMQSLKVFMTQTMLTSISASYLKTDAAKDAVLVLQGSEKQMVVNPAGKKLGYGAWNFANDELAIYTYMGQCAAAEWSLAKYYQGQYYESLGKQCIIVADCLEKIAADSGFAELLDSFGQLEKKGQIEEMVPQLKQLSTQLVGPHKALNVNDSEFASLIELLLSMEGQVKPIDISNGVYAYKSIRRNGEKTGSLDISVQVGAAPAKKREISYILEDAKHALTVEEAEQIQAYIAELESSFGLTEEEKQYYDLIATNIPEEGTIVGKNETVNLVYSPKEYTVTVAGIKGYKATFKYKSDYVIELPAYSKDTEEISYYCYLINGEKKKVYNGSVGYYTFKKEDLTELFENQHYEISVEILKNISEWDVVAEVNLAEANAAGKICGSYLDFDNKILFLDAVPTGLTLANFQKYVGFVTGAGGEVSYTIYNSNLTTMNMIGTGTIVECTSEDRNGDPVVTEYTIILMGDVNKDSYVDEKDLQRLTKNYLGTAESGEQIGEAATKLAADMNGNGNYCDSNDGLYITKKYSNWGKNSDEIYRSVL